MPGLRLHPLSLLQPLLKSIPALVLGLIPSWAGQSRGDNTILVVVLVLYSCVALPLIAARYLRFRYWINAGEIVLHSGILTRRKRNIPLERIQNIAIERSLLPRILGTAKVKIETAGSTDAEGVLECVHLNEALRIRSMVRNYRQNSAADAPDALPHEGEQSGAQLIFALPLRRLLLSGAFRFSLLYIAIIFSGFQILANGMNIAAEDFSYWLARLGVEEHALAAGASRWALAGILAACAVILAWLSGLVLQVVRYYDFKLHLDGARLQRSHGLLTVREGVIPLKRLQALIIRTNPLMRRFGWFRLQLQTVGYDVAKEGYQTGVPFARLEEVLRVAARIKRIALPETFERVSKLTIRRTFVRYLLVLLLLLIVPSVFWPNALWSLCATPLLLYLAILQYRHHGYALQDGYLFVRRGVFRHCVWIVPAERFQVFYRQGTLLQRRLGLRTLIVDTAGAGALEYPRIVDVTAGAAVELTDRAYAEFKRYMNLHAEYSH